MDRAVNYRLAYEKAQEVLKEVRKVVHGKDNQVEKAFSAILARGHILIEDVPGVGKTTLAVAFSKVMALENHRVQFTPDVQPSDILGFSVYNKQTGTFSYKAGPVLCNLFLADEVNRTSPKTQSALLEVMEEGMVTVDGISHKVPEPFIVIATQNPKGSAGTQLLPESQLDRFMISMSMGYPDLADEIEIARGKSTRFNTAQLFQVLQAEELQALQDFVEQVHVHDNIYKYIAKLMGATRENPYIELGVSPRGTIACTRMARARAFLQGRNYVIPEDVAEVYKDVAKHRIVLNTKARVAHVKEEAVLEQILEEVKQPASYMKRNEYRD
ncbi:MAG: MoxR family ATPase [Lachnospiraceae bacterium]|nr:MoxR family ATPase [Lachnospiraceae bacterium]